MNFREQNRLVVPSFFRVLIVDDKVPLDMEYRDFFTSYLVHLISRYGIPKKNIHVCFEHIPESGLDRWVNEYFDLTLIDADFSYSNVKSHGHASGKQRFLYYSKRQGLAVLRQFHDWVHAKNGRLSYRRGVNQFYLWSGHSEETRTQLFEQFELPKNKYDWDKQKPLIDLILDRLKFIEECNDCRESWCLPNKIERLITAERFGFHERAEQSWYDGVVVLSDDREKKVIEYYDTPPAKLKITDQFIPMIGSIICKDQKGWIDLPDIISSVFPKNPGSKSGDMLYDLKEQYIERVCQNSNNPGKISKRNQAFILGFPFKNRIVAAATPLTGSTIVGEAEAIKHLLEKVEMMLAGPYGAVILKTVYLDKKEQWKNCHWPGIQAQSHHRSRCLYPDTGTPTLWNTGKTAMEMFTPAGLNAFLIKAKGTFEKNTHKIIVSLGSKFFPKNKLKHHSRLKAAAEYRLIWNELFKLVFKDLKGYFPLVEINVRHFLREIAKEYLGGDEYLTPVSIDEVKLKHENLFWEEYKLWLEVINDVALRHKKILILKFPHRTDTLGLIKCAVDLRKWFSEDCKTKRSRNHSYGIRGITLVNALKTPVPNNSESEPFTPAWYSAPFSWRDAKNKQYKYQMSGDYIAPYRDQLLAGFLSKKEYNTLKKLEMCLFFSGGITKDSDLRHIHSQFKGNKIEYGIQIGTWGLLNGNMKNKKWDKIARGCAKPAISHQIRQLDMNSCNVKCCSKEKLDFCPEKNIRKKADGKFDIRVDFLCHECADRVCVTNCDQGNIKLVKPKVSPFEIGNRENNAPKWQPEHENTIAPRLCFANTRMCFACGACIGTFYCDSFFDRKNDQLPPLHDPRNCTGCGLCVQVCQSGALHLYDPSEFIVLISDKVGIGKTLRINNIPFLKYSLSNDIYRVRLFSEKCDGGKLSSEMIDVCSVNNKSALKVLIEKLWEKRVPGSCEPTRKKYDQFVLGAGSGDFFKERRWDRKAQCKSGLEILLEAEEDATWPALWSQTIWSDPGQVLWDSFILVVTEDRLIMLRQGRYLFSISFSKFAWQDIIRAVSGLDDKQYGKDKDDFVGVCKAIEKRSPVTTE